MGVARFELAKAYLYAAVYTQLQLSNVVALPTTQNLPSPADLDKYFLLYFTSPR